MRNLSEIFLSIAFAIISSCNGQCSSDHVISADSIKVDAYSSYNNSILPSMLKVESIHSHYDTLINYALDLIGLPSTDISIEMTSKFGAFSIMNSQGQRKFLYSPFFFDSVYKVTQTSFAILSICFHELAHQFYRHPLKPSFGSHIYEKQADRYSGFEMAIVGASLEQSLLAMKYFGNDSETMTHPDKASRLAEIEKGYIDARIKIFKDPNYIKQDSAFKMQEFMSAIYVDASFAEVKNIKYSVDSIQINSNKASNKSNTKQVYSLYGELIYLSKDNVKLVSNGQSIGQIFQPNESLKYKILNIDGVKFYLEDRIIYSINPEGYKLEVGKNIFN
jgi:hypothetical protein